jgi:glycosyltransferase 2 family protein
MPGGFTGATTDGCERRAMFTDVETTRSGHWARLKNAGAFLLKLAVTCISLWYVARQVNVGDFKRLLGTLDFAWAALASLVLMAETPLVGLRWRAILNGLQSGVGRIPAMPIVAITAITVFVAQILPNVAADGIRVWLLARTGRSWRQGLPSVVIDRGLGVFCLIVIGFVTLLFPSALAALAGHRPMVLGLFGLIIAGTVAGILLVPYVSPLLERFSLTRLAGSFALATHDLLVRSRARWWILAAGFLIHLLTIVAVWLLGRAQGLDLPLVDSALLFTLMVSVALVPVSVGGWGLRELAVSSLLGSHGVPLEQALFFSVSFGVVLIVAALPGAVVWAFFSPARHAAAGRNAHE